MHGVCGQISRLEELSILLPGCQYDFMTACKLVKKQTLPSLPPECTSSSDVPQPLNSAPLPSFSAVPSPTQVCSPRFAHISCVISSQSQLPLETVAPYIMPGATESLCTISLVSVLLNSLNEDDSSNIIYNTRFYTYIYKNTLSNTSHLESLLFSLQGIL